MTSGVPLDSVKIIQDAPGIARGASGPLVTPEAKAAVEAAKADIIAGKISVHNYNTDNTCPGS